MYFGTINYVNKLVNDGERDKAKAFWEYCYDMEFQTKTVNYADSWGVDPLKASEWIGEFFTAIQDEIQNSRAKHSKHTKAL